MKITAGQLPHGAPDAQSSYTAKDALTAFAGKEPIFFHETSRGFGMVVIPHLEGDILLIPLTPEGDNKTKGQWYTLKNAKELVADLTEMISIIEGEK